MKQVSKSDSATNKLTALRLDPISHARLDWLKAFYAHHGEQVSSSIIIRRAIEVLTDELGDNYGGKPPSLTLELEIGRVLSCANNKPDPFAGEYPWQTPRKIFKSYKSYTPTLVNSLPSFLSESPYHP